jgi:phage tail-like protein
MDFGKLILYRQGEQPADFRLRLGSLSVGSDPTADISVDDPSADGFHLRVVCTPAGCQLTDLGSRSGVIVNKDRIAPNRPVRLQDGDRIRFGRSGLLYSAPRPAEPVQPEQPVAVATPETTAPTADPQPVTAQPVTAQPVAPTPQPQPIPQPTATPSVPVQPRPQPQPSTQPTRQTTPLAPPDEWATLFEVPALATTNGVAQTVLPSNRRRKLPRNEERELPYAADDYLALLPPIFHDDRFLRRYLLIFKAILGPLDRQIAQISYYFDPLVAPEQLLPWLAGWVDLALDDRWPDMRRRELIREASVLYRWRGTRRGLSDYLRIYTGVEPRIVEQGQERRERGDAPVPAHTFRVIIETPDLATVDRALVERIIEQEKPAHTSYQLELRAPR